MAGDKEIKRLETDPQANSRDLYIAEVVQNASSSEVGMVAYARLTFDGYKLRWHGVSPDEFDAFSGQADLSARESKKDLGPTPQGLFAIDPKNIEELVPSDGWGSYRVRIEPYRPTVKRMSDCFEAIRTNMYIHGGKIAGTRGCIEINDDAQEKSFFSKLKGYTRKIELEVKFVGEMKNKLEEPKCPY